MNTRPIDPYPSRNRASVQQLLCQCRLETALLSPDGDAIRVRITGRLYRVRLAYIDAPELDQPDDGCESKLVRIIASHLPAINWRKTECEVDC